jgi:hypothetical protein
VKKQRQPPFLWNRANTMSQDLLKGGPSRDYPYSIQGGQRGQGEMAAEDNLSLHQKMDELTEKIERLTTLLMAQQDSPSDVL